jgi:hypothetical protein
VRARHAPLGLLFLATAVAVACSASKDPSPHPSNVVDCHAPPVTSVTGPKCPGVCLDHDRCDGAAPTCPPAFKSEGYYGCPNDALCCVLPGDAGDEGGTAEAGSHEGGAGDGAADADAQGD